MHSFPLIVLQFIYQNGSNNQELYNNTRGQEILHTLNRGCSFITRRESFNNQLPRCDSAWLHATNHLYHGFPSQTVKQSHHVQATVNVKFPSQILYKYYCTLVLLLHQKGRILSSQSFKYPNKRVQHNFENEIFYKVAQLNITHEIFL